MSPLTFEIAGLEKVLEQAFLATDFTKDPKAVLAELYAFSKKYKDWVELLSVRRSEFADKVAFDEIRRRCNEAAQRMDDGIELLENNEEVRTAFIWANLGMLIQAAQYKGILAQIIGRIASNTST